MRKLIDSEGATSRTLCGRLVELVLITAISITGSMTIVYALESQLAQTARISAV